MNASTAYRLGRNRLYVMPHFSNSKTTALDAYLGRTVYYLEFFLRAVIGVIPRLVMTSITLFSYWVGNSIVRRLRHPAAEKFQGYFVTNISDDDRQQAYGILCDRCEEVCPRAVWEDVAVTIKLLDKRVLEILRNHQQSIDLHLLLDDIGPRALMYLLCLLDHVLASIFPPEHESIDF